ncbi:uncharacterized protein NPIL_596421 [Nephila pilipes]|uniref:Uncharacterized protein n=1 Tax=Nephila pilipes TaxID=299642 RepID=A0A8X6TRY4_NEPPI|nr:uncharacterized protein NPIL_596421 [Nephila pilipes]
MSVRVYDKAKIQLEKCYKKVVPIEYLVSEEKRWKYYCEHPDEVAKTYDCLTTGDNWNALTSEDVEALKTFKECVQEMKKSYCQAD